MNHNFVKFLNQFMWLCVGWGKFLLAYFSPVHLKVLYLWVLVSVFSFMFPCSPICIKRSVNPGPSVPFDQCQCVLSRLSLCPLARFVERGLATGYIRTPLLQRTWGCESINQIGKYCRERSQIAGPEREGHLNAVLHCKIRDSIDSFIYCL